MNKNINDHNGKEIQGNQVQKNVKKEGDIHPVDRVKKKNPVRGKEIQPSESKKTPVNIQKSSSMPNKNAPKKKVIKLGDRDKRIHPVDSPVKKSPGQNVNSSPPFANGKSFTKQAPPSNTVADNSQRYTADAERPKYSANTSNYLYIIAAVLLIAWIIGFFFYKLGANIHMLLALAIIVGIISFLQGRKK